MNEEKISLVVLCPKCNRTVLADAEPEKMDRKEKNYIGRLAAQGFKIDHKPLDETAFPRAWNSRGCSQPAFPRV